MSEHDEGLPCAAMLLSILGLPGTSVEIDRDYDDNYCVSVHPHLAHGRAATLTGAVRQAWQEVTRFDTVTTRDAARRARVRLPEGGQGTLVYLHNVSRSAHVVTDEGRHRHLPARCIQLVES